MYYETSAHLKPNFVVEYESDAHNVALSTKSKHVVVDCNHTYRSRHPLHIVSIMAVLRERVEKRSRMFLDDCIHIFEYDANGHLTDDTELLSDHPCNSNRSLAGLHISRFSWTRHASN